MIVILAAWILHSFLQAVLAACVTAIASWPLYDASRPVAAAPGRSATPLLFTCLMIVFVLAPLMFAFGALLTEAHALMLEIARRRAGLPLPRWIEKPAAGRTLGDRALARRARAPGDAAALGAADRSGPLLGWPQSLGSSPPVTPHHRLRDPAAVLPVSGRGIAGGRVQPSAAPVASASGPRPMSPSPRGPVRASVNSVLVVGLFAGLAIGVAYAIARRAAPCHLGRDHRCACAGPFPRLRRGDRADRATRYRWRRRTGAAFPGAGLCRSVLRRQVVRPLVARDGIRLHFVWILMGCLGGFGVLGLVGLVIGPVALTLASGLWRQWARETALPSATDSKSSSRHEQGVRLHRRCPWQRTLPRTAPWQTGIPQDSRCSWRRPIKTAIFTGDLIDRGSRQLRRWTSCAACA